MAETVVVVPKVVDDSTQAGNLSLLVASFETLKALFEECNAVFGPLSCGPLCKSILDPLFLDPTFIGISPTRLTASLHFQARASAGMTW
jgi:hypothetical protein